MAECVGGRRPQHAQPRPVSAPYALVDEALIATPAAHKRVGWVPGNANVKQNDFIITPGRRMEELRGAAANRAQGKALQLMAGKLGQGAASPYQKSSAITAAEQAIRPWAPHVGLGERDGRQQLVTGQAEAAGYADPSAPSLFQPNREQAEAMGRAGSRVARAGSEQMYTAYAWSPAAGHPPRELWPKDLVEPPRYCVACRGDHKAENEFNPGWEPYTPQQRLTNLRMLRSKFQVALRKGHLLVALSDDPHQPVRWTRVDAEGNSLTPARMDKETFTKQLALMFDGIREGHEPFRFLATEAAKAFLATHSPLLVLAAPDLAKPIKLGLNTMEPRLAGHMMNMLKMLLTSHPQVGRALAPHFKHFLPVMAVMKGQALQLHLPPPFCCAPAGSFAGGVFVPKSASRSCPECGFPVDKELAVQAARQAVKALHARNAALADHMPLPEAFERKALAGRKSKKYVLSELIEELLGVMVETGGRQGRLAVQSYIPTFCYYDPKD